MVPQPVMKLLSISNFALRLGFPKLVPREILALSSTYKLRSTKHENDMQGRNHKHKFAKNLLGKPKGSGMQRDSILPSRILQEYKRGQRYRDNLPPDFLTFRCLSCNYLHSVSATYQGRHDEFEQGKAQYIFYPKWSILKPKI